MLTEHVEILAPYFGPIASHPYCWGTLKLGTFYLKGHVKLKDTAP